MSNALSSAPKEQDAAIMGARRYGYIKGVFKPKKFEDSIATAVTENENVTDNPEIVEMVTNLVELCEKLPGAEKVKRSEASLPPTTSQEVRQDKEAPETEDTGKAKKRLEARIQNLSKIVRGVAKESEAGKEAYVDYTEAIVQKDSGNLDAAKKLLDKVDENLEKNNDIVETRSRANDVKVQLDHILKSSSESELALRAKSLVDAVLKDLRGSDVKLDAIKSRLDEVETILANDELGDDGEPLIGDKELRTLLAKAAKADEAKSFPFACCEDKTGKFCFTIHKRKKSPSLGKNLKRETGCSPAKLTFGDATISKKEKVINLNVAEKSSDFPKLFKHMKLWLRENKPLPAKKALIKLADGREVVPGRDEILEIMNAYEKRVFTVLSNLSPLSDKVSGLWNDVTKMVNDNEDIGTIMAKLPELEAALDQYEDQKAWEREQTTIAFLFDSIQIKARMDSSFTRPDNFPKIEKAWEVGKKSAANLDFDQALTIASQVKSALSSINKSGAGSMAEGREQEIWIEASEKWLLFAKKC